MLFVSRLSEALVGAGKMIQSAAKHGDTRSAITATRSEPARLDTETTSIPSGLHPPAQGCEERATLGDVAPDGQPQRGCARVRQPKPQPLRGRCPVAREFPG